jgi:hypothetical protein
MISALAEANAQATERAREAEEHADRVKLILELSKEIAGSLDLRYVVESVGRAAAAVSGFPKVYVWLLDPDARVLTEVYGSRTGDVDGALSDGSTIDATEGVVGRAARYGRASTVAPDGSLVDAGESATDLAVPMVVGARVIGVSS